MSAHFLFSYNKFRNKVTTLVGTSYHSILVSKVSFIRIFVITMDDKEYLILEFLYNQKYPISFNQLDEGLAGNFVNKQNDNILNHLANVESKGLLSDKDNNTIEINKLGRTFFEKENKIRKKQALTKSREDWVKRNWFIADAIKFTIGAIVGSAITLLTILLTDSRNKHQDHTLQNPVLPQDTLNKKWVH